VFLSVLFAIVYGLVTGQGPKWLHEARERAKAQAQQARYEAALARSKREQIELDRDRVLYGWAGAGSGGEVYKVALVTDAAEMNIAARELATPKTPSQYVMLRTRTRSATLAARPRCSDQPLSCGPSSGHVTYTAGRTRPVADFAVRASDLLVWLTVAYRS
jgi:hypothetical protein